MATGGSYISIINYLFIKSIRLKLDSTFLQTIFNIFYELFQQMKKNRFNIWQKLDQHFFSIVFSGAGVGKSTGGGAAGPGGGGARDRA